MHRLATAALMIGLGVAGDRACYGQNPVLPLTKAIQATEMPEGAWGAYSRSHAGPCYLAERFPQQLYSFPIIVGEMRTETIRTTKQQPDGKERMVSENVVLRRRSIGIAPVHAESDDVPAAGSGAGLNRRVRAIEADADGYQWKQSISFTEAKPVQHIIALPDDSGVPGVAPPWGSGKAILTCFPAFVDPGADGLLIRVELNNTSSARETWFVDLLGGIDSSSKQFQQSDLSLDSTGAYVTLQHAKSNQAFCLAIRSPVVVSTAIVDDTYFSQGAAVSPDDVRGAITVPGKIDTAAPAGAGKAKWGLTSANSIVVGAGEHLVIWLCVGVGKDSTAAIASERLLLNVAEDTPVKAKVQRVGAYSQASAQHEKSRYVSGSTVIDRLMAQSLLNVPCTVSRRLGVASRCAPGEDTYRPDIGGYIGLGWAGYRPDWCASQLNAWFATLSDPTAPLSSSHARPSEDLFVLWQLYQQTGSEDLLKYAYKHARRRYLEMRDGCRIADGSWLFSWPKPQPDGTTAQIADPAADPECSSWVAASALILSRIGSIIGAPEGDIKGYEDDQTHTYAAITTGLWSEANHQFARRQASALKADGAFGDADYVASLMPVICGSLGGEFKAAVLKRLQDPEQFWSGYGLRSVSKRSKNYRSTEWMSGGVNYGYNWLVWQGLIDLGEFEIARSLAEGLIDGYTRAAGDSLQPQFLDGDTGSPSGAMDWSGDAGCIIAMYEAYHIPGRVTAGHNMAILDHRYDAAADSLRIVCKQLSQKSDRILQIVMGRANVDYSVTGDSHRTVRSDDTGAISLQLAPQAGTQQIEISAIGSLVK